MNNLQEVWTHCLFCPLCQDVCRNINIFPLAGISIENLNKKNEFIEFDCHINNSKKSAKGLRVHYKLDAINNSFEFEIRKPGENMQISNISMEMSGGCNKCKKTYSISSSFDLDIKEQNIKNFGIDKDSVMLFDGNNYYHITILNYSKQLLVSKCDDDSFLSEGEAISLPLINLDFTNPKAILTRIKTLLILS
jgi:hypothetical protein